MMSQILLEALDRACCVIYPIWVYALVLWPDFSCIFLWSLILDIWHSRLCQEPLIISVSLSIYTYINCIGVSVCISEGKLSMWQVIKLALITCIMQHLTQLGSKDWRNWSSHTGKIKSHILYILSKWMLVRYFCSVYTKRVQQGGAWLLTFLRLLLCAILLCTTVMHDKVWKC